MKKNYFVSLLILCFTVFCFELAFAASNLEEGVSQLANQISKNMQEKQSKKIAIIDFSDLNGNVTTLGQFMAEELTTQLFMIAPGKFEVIERRQLLKLIDELSLGQLGLIDEKSIKEMGRVLGVDAIVTGSLTDLGNTVKVNARMIAVESAKVVAVAASEIQKTGVVADLLGKQGEGRQTGMQTKTQKDMPQSQQKVEVQDFLFELQQCKAKHAQEIVREIPSEYTTDKTKVVIKTTSSPYIQLSATFYFPDIGNPEILIFPFPSVENAKKQCVLVKDGPIVNAFKERFDILWGNEEENKYSLKELAATEIRS